MPCFVIVTEIYSNQQTNSKTMHLNNILGPDC